MPKKLKILLVTPEFPPNHIGGGGIVFDNLARQYKRKGHDITVLSANYRAINKEITLRRVDEVDVYEIPLYPTPKFLPFLRTALPFSRKHLVKIRALIETFDVDVVHAYGYGLISVNEICKVVKDLGIPYIFTLQGYPKSYLKLGIIGKAIWSLFTKYSTTPTLKNAYAITGCSDFIVKDQQNIYPEKSYTIYNGLDAQQFLSTNPHQIDIRSLHNIPQDTRIIYSLGRIHEMKGFQLVIDKLSELNRGSQKYHYLIAGDDDGYLDNLKRQVAKLNLNDFVTFVGFHNHDQKVNYIYQADIFAVPSLWEPFGIVCLEGAVFNKPILTTDVGGIKEVLGNYDRKINIYSQTLADDIEKAINNSQNRFDINEYSWDKIADQYISLLQEAADHAR